MDAMPAWPAFAAPGAEVLNELHANHLGGAVAQQVIQSEHSATLTPSAIPDGASTGRSLRCPLKAMHIASSAPCLLALGSL
jgi:hypothetical protein